MARCPGRNEHVSSASNRDTSRRTAPFSWLSLPPHRRLAAPGPRARSPRRRRSRSQSPRPSRGTTRRPHQVSCWANLSAPSKPSDLRPRHLARREARSNAYAGTTRVTVGAPTRQTLVRTTTRPSRPPAGWIGQWRRRLSGVADLRTAPRSIRAMSTQWSKDYAAKTRRSRARSSRRRSRANRAGAGPGSRPK